jgi:hypothetical protein
VVVATMAVAVVVAKVVVAVVVVAVVVAVFAVVVGRLWANHVVDVCHNATFAFTLLMVGSLSATELHDTT